MLANIPAVRANLREWGAEFHIIGAKEQTSDLPEFRAEKGKYYVDTRGVRTTIDERTRGKGGLYTSCGEENLLQLPGDRYGGGSDICIHEFAHAIMDFGLDEQAAQKIVAQYKKTVAKGLWRKAYASINEGEFWAELSMWYFGAHGEFLDGTQQPAAGPEVLRAYDPESFALLDSIYTGLVKVSFMKVRPVVKVTSRRKPKVETQKKAYLLITNDGGAELQAKLFDAKQKITVVNIPAYSYAVQPTFINAVLAIQSPNIRRQSYWRVNSAFAKLRYLPPTD